MNQYLLLTRQGSKWLKSHFSRANICHPWAGIGEEQCGGRSRLREPGTTLEVNTLEFPVIGRGSE